MQMVVAYIFFNAHWDTVTANLSDSVAADVSLAVELYKQEPSSERANRLDDMLRPNMELSVALQMEDELPEKTRDAFFSALDKTLRRALTQSLEDPFWFDTTRYPNHIDIRVEVDEGVLRFIAARERVFAPTGFVFIFWLFTASVLLTLVSIIFIRNQARPIAELAAAADAFGKGQEISNFKPSGASEVRLAGHSFLKMGQRIKRFVDQRTIFLAGVSHDLRTPITRLNLHLAMQDDTEENRAARQDLKDMSSMLNAYLDFARGLSGEETKVITLKSFISEVSKGFDPMNLHIDISEAVQFKAKPTSLKRAVENLISNALKYGNKCWISSENSAERIHIIVEDDGPGIQQTDHDEALKPFHRLDASRNQNIEGVGLGLSISQDIIQSHGGSLSLEESLKGGLKVIVSLPA